MMNRELLKPTLALVLFSGSFGHASASVISDCGKYIVSNVLRRETPLQAPLDNGTDKFIAYLEVLLERQIIDDTELWRLIEAMEMGEVVNPISEDDARVSSRAHIHRRGIQEYISRTQLDHKTLLDWAKQNLKEKERVRGKREEVRAETQDLYKKIELHPVKAGKFLMGDSNGDDIVVVLTYPIEVMSTPVTQKQWVEVMGENPSHFQEGEHSIVVRLNDRAIRMQPDNPVENVTWWSMLMFANRLSERHGFKPVYDFSGVTIKPGTRAENGTLEVESGELKVYANGDFRDPYHRDFYYRTEGYRLPSEAEQAYMLRAAGTASGDFYFGDDIEELKDHAWYIENSGGKTHPVARLKPLILDGKEFYDLLGNVAERGWDDFYYKLKGGKNPLGPKKGHPFRSTVVLGGSFDENVFFMRTYTGRYGWPPDSRRGNADFADIGFRLVRTIAEKRERICLFNCLKMRFHIPFFVKKEEF